MSRQHSAPYLVADSEGVALRVLEGAFNEAWLQEFVFRHSEALPISEIEPIFGSLIPVCRELRTSAGPVDILFVNSEGLLTLVECKLWMNPEARREVIGQILDYAKDVSTWSYEQLQESIRNSTKGKVSSLFEVVANSSEELDERDFIDSVSRNLKRGRFLLLIVGSGIRESVELLTDFLQRHAHMNFTLALVEIGIFRIPENSANAYLALPRIIAKTVEIERAVIRIEEGNIVAELPPAEGTKTGTRRTISEQAFYEELAKADPRASRELQEFLDRAKELGLYVEPGDNSLKLKFVSGDVELNLGVFRKDGTFQNYRIALMTERLGHPEIGEAYLTRLALLFQGAHVQKGANKFTWTVKKQNNQPLTIGEVLAVRTRWLEIIQDTISELSKVQEKDA